MEDSDYDNLPPPGDEFAAIWPTLGEQNVDELVEMYRRHRDELAVVRKSFNQKEANVKDLLSRIGMALRDKADALGVTSFATPSGTAYKSKKTKYRVADWSAFVDYVKANDLYHLFEKRVAKLAVMEVHEERKNQAVPDGEEFDPVPPGLMFIEEVVMDVRKPTAKRK